MPTYVIKPYKKETGMWTFKTPNDEYQHLPVRTEEENSLVSGIDRILDSIKEQFPDFSIRFSNTELEHTSEVLASICLTWTTRGDTKDPKNGGNWYKDQFGNEGWLCSVLFDYFPIAPKHIYLHILK